MYNVNVRTEKNVLLVKGFSALVSFQKETTPRKKRTWNPGLLLMAEKLLSFLDHEIFGFLSGL